MILVYLLILNSELEHEQKDEKWQWLLGNRIVLSFNLDVKNINENNNRQDYAYNVWHSKGNRYLIVKQINEKLGYKKTEHDNDDPEVPWDIFLMISKLIFYFGLFFSYLQVLVYF